MPRRKDFLEEQLALRGSLSRSAAMMENDLNATEEELVEVRGHIAAVDARIDRLRSGRLCQSKCTGPVRN